MKKITITIQCLVKGRLFKVNEQYCYTAIITRLIGCGCGGKPKTEKKFFNVSIGDIVYEIPFEFAVETVVEISCEDQDFEKRRENLGETQQTKDFNPFRKNNDPKVIFCAANQGDAAANVPR